MNLSEPLVIELQNEAVNTRRYLEVVPAESFDWKPHPKSMNLGTLSRHIAELAGWLHYVIDAPDLDFATMDYKPPVLTDNASLIKVFEDNLQLGMNSLKNASNENLFDTWKLRNGDYIIMEMPRISVIRSTVFNHLYHHRGQLGVFLRLLDVKLPGLYGPSADEMG